MNAQQRLDRIALTKLFSTPRRKISSLFSAARLRALELAARTEKQDHARIKRARKSEERALSDLLLQLNPGENDNFLLQEVATVIAGGAKNFRSSTGFFTIVRLDIRGRYADIIVSMDGPWGVEQLMRGGAIKLRYAQGACRVHTSVLLRMLYECVQVGDLSRAAIYAK